MSEEQIILMTRCLSKSFSGLKAVNNVTSYFIRGRIYAIAGPNGAGKTTFFNLLSGFFPPDKGEIFFNQKNVTQTPAWERSRLGIARLFQDIRVFSNLKTMDNLLCFENNRYSRNPFTIPFHTKQTRQIDKEHKEKAHKILERFNIDPDTYAGNLSYGQQKLVAMGRILMGNSNLLLLDEPFAGIHTGFRKMIRDLLVDYTKNGNTVILIEHDISFISEFVEWVYLFVGGKRVTFGKIDEILSSEEVVKGIWGI